MDIGQKITAPAQVREILVMIESFQFEDGDAISTELAKQAILFLFSGYLQAKDGFMATRRWRANQEITSAGGMSFSKIQLCDVAILALFEWRNKCCGQKKSRESVAGDLGSELGEYFEKLNATKVLRVEPKFEMRQLRRVERQMRDWGVGEIQIRSENGQQATIVLKGAVSDAKTKQLLEESKRSLKGTWAENIIKPRIAEKRSLLQIPFGGLEGKRRSGRGRPKSAKTNVDNGVLRRVRFCLPTSKSLIEEIGSNPEWVACSNANIRKDRKYKLGQ